jgi:hypothetical protein
MVRQRASLQRDFDVKVAYDFELGRGSLFVLRADGRGSELSASG